MLFFRISASLIFAMSVAVACLGQIENVKLYNISREQGLPSENVQQIFQDSYGFLWIGSFDGLFRWDGSTYKKYYSSSEENSISNNVVYSIFEDSKGRLWIGTLSGLNLYRRELDDFFRCHFDETHRKIAVNAIVEDSKHNLWLGASSGLFRYDHDRRTSVMFDDKISPGLSDHVIFGMDIDSHDNLWLGTFHGGVNKYSITENQFTTFQHKENDARTICSNMINEIRVDHLDRIWVGSFNNGISVIDREGKVLGHYVINPSGKTQNIVSSIYEDKQKRIWVGTINEPLHYLSAEQNRLLPLVNTKSGNARCQSVTIVSEDSFDNLWFGTQTEGLFYTNKNKNRFEYYANDDRKSAGLRGKIVTSFVTARDKTIWIGTNGGLTHFDAITQSFETYTTSEGLVSNDVYEVRTDDNGNLWIATWNGGVSRFDLKTRQFKNYIHEPNNVYSLNYNNVKSILPEDSIIWVGTHGEGLAVLNTKTNRFTHRGNNKEFPFDLGKPAWINHLMRDTQNRLWISTYNGVFMYDRRSLFHFSHAIDSSISGNAINMVIEDQDNKIWALNEQGAIDLYDSAKRKFVKFYQSSPGAKAFVIDNRNVMWISSNEGIEALDLTTMISRKFDASDGIIGSSFFNKAVMKGEAGKLFFGSTYGFNAFHPDSIRSFDYEVRPYLLSFFLYDSIVVPNGKNDILKFTLNFTDTIKLSYDQAFFTIAFTATNLLSANNTKFSYKLSGLHDKWVDTHGERKASFTNLDPGTYTFSLRYTSAKGEWVESKKNLVIIVYPPWWLSTWFKVLSLVSLVLLVVFTFYIRLNSIKARNKFLEREVKKRTHDLSEVNAFLVERNEEINRQSDKILQQQQQIVSQNTMLEKSVEEEKRLNQVKNRFFSILAHDLRNPIYTLSGISDRLKMNLYNIDKKEIEKYVNKLHKSATSINNLLNTLLHWGATHTKSITNSPTDFPVTEVVRNNAQLLELEFQQKNITLTIMVNIAHRVYADYNMIDTALRNLLANSVKFTYPNGEVVVMSEEVEEEILIKVSDNGIGMTKEQIENIFNIEKQGLAKGTAGETGTGLGLIVSREFIEANRGSIAVVSTLGTGSTFTVRLPKAKTKVKDEVDVKQYMAPAQGEFDDLENFPIEELVRVRGKKILIVEDNQELRNHLQLYLSSIFEIFDAPNGKAGLALAIDIEPALIISDVSMPLMDGVQFCMEVKRNSKLSHIPFVLLTSNSSDETQLSGYTAGADAYLTKPVKKKVLFQVILNFFGSQEKMRQRILDSNGFLTNEPVVNKSDMEFLDRVIVIIDNHIEDTNLDFVVITENLAMSKTVVYNRLKSITGLGIQEFIKSIRLKKSLKLLSEGKLSINEIAQRVGFSSQSYFNKCFVKQFNITPKAYMNKTRKASTAL